MLGGDVLVVPAWVGNFEIPQGWKVIDFEDYTPGQATLYLRPGAAIPLCEQQMKSTQDYVSDKLTILANPDEYGNALGFLYLDAGEGYGYRTGDFALLKLVVEDRNKLGSAKISGNRHEKLEFSLKLL